jgi:hypothetical protein
MGKKSPKSLIDKSLDGIIVKAEDISTLAKNERVDADSHQASADRQHFAAHKLEKLSDALREEVAKIKEERDENTDRS